MKKSSFFFAHLREGLIVQNPVLIQLLGMCPTLAMSSSMDKAIGMGLAATAVLICSNVMISLLRRFIPKEVRIAAYIVIIAGFVTAVQMLMQAYLPSLYEALGTFLALIVVNCIILARAESFASKNKPLPSAWDGVCMGLGFTFALTLLSFGRELIGNGTLFGYDIPFFTEHYTPMALLTAAPGAFIALGALIALVTWIRERSARKEKINQKPVMEVAEEEAK